MRRALQVAVWSGMLTLAPLCMAQYGGGHGGFSGGHMGGIGSYHGGFVSGPGRIATAAPQGIGSAPRINLGSPRFVAPYNAPLYGGVPAHFHNGNGWEGNGGHRRDYDHDGDRHRQGYGYGYGGYGYGYGVPYVNSWDVLPWDIGSDFYDQSSIDQSGDNGSSQAASGNQQQNGQNQQYPNQPYQQQQYQGPPAPPPDYAAEGYRPEYDTSQPPAPTEKPVLASEPSLSLIFKDGHTQSIRNFVLTPSAVIDMDQASSGRQIRIPLSEVNVTATQQAAEAQGLDFNPPA